MTPREIRLLELELRAFKGSGSYRLELDGSSAIVRGDNATGKTTLHDAYTWLLFGKDAANRSTFEVKTLDSTGAPISGVDHEVRGVFSIDGERVELRRVYRETWTKKRGSSTAELTGHSTDFEVDGVPVKKKEWTERVADLFGPEDRLRIVTDPLYFASVLPWDERRKMLLELVGDVTEAEVEALEPDLVELRKALGKRSHDEHAKVLGARRREINLELDRLPVRVDEAARALEGAPTETSDELDRLIADARGRVAELEAAAAPDATVARLRAELASARKRLELARADAERDRRLELAKADREVSRATGEVDRARARVQRAEADLARIREELKASERRLEELRLSYATARLDEAVVEVSGVCPCCSRPLEADAVDEARRKATDEANARKAANLRRIAAQGQSARVRHDALEARRVDADAELVDARGELEAAEEGLAEARNVRVPEAAEFDQVDQLLEIGRLEADLNAAIAGTSSADQAELDAARALVRELLERQARAVEADRARARVSELEAKERDLALEIEKVDRGLFLLDLRARARARILTERVDERFDLVRFRLFVEQLNGGLAEACDVTVQGVPWSDLNHGARMNAGLDVLRAFGAFYGVRAPVWLDNAESVTSWRPSGAQTIRLEVDAKAAKLDVELLPE